MLRFRDLCDDEPFEDKRDVVGSVLWAFNLHASFALSLSLSLSLWFGALIESEGKERKRRKKVCELRRERVDEDYHRYHYHQV